MAAACQSLERERIENQRLREDISRQTTLLDEILLSTTFWKLTAPLRDYGKLRQDSGEQSTRCLPLPLALEGGALSLELPTKRGADVVQQKYCAWHTIRSEL